MHIKKEKQKEVEEFKPHDEIIEKQIFVQMQQKLKLKEQKLEQNMATIQTDIDNAKTVDALKTVFDNASLGE